MWTVDRPPQWVGRGQELAALRAGVDALGRGEGAVVWVEGSPASSISCPAHPPRLETGARRHPCTNSARASSGCCATSPTNMSRPQIATELSVSVNTVSTDIRNIYAKLGAGGRSAAVHRARELRLLSVTGIW